MILADTSVWIDHLRDRNPSLMQLLLDDALVCHPIVVGELACGTFRDRAAVLSMLRQLPQLMEAQHDEVLSLIENHRLMGMGLAGLIPICSRQ
jgi:predicted nucleic acid-binding protein